jgi:hypothetical protein
MRGLLATDFGAELYAKRQGMIEPVFAHTKFNRGMDRFLRRGRAACRSEWRLITATHNLVSSTATNSRASEPKRPPRHRRAGSPRNDDGNREAARAFVQQPRRYAAASLARGISAGHGGARESERCPGAVPLGQLGRPPARM